MWGAYTNLFLSDSPWRIVDDCGGAFTMGMIGGGVFQAVKGFRNAPVVSSTYFIFNLYFIWFYYVLFPLSSKYCIEEMECVESTFLFQWHLL